jgi:hypothetical protein
MDNQMPTPPEPPAGTPPPIQPAGLTLSIPSRPIPVGMAILAIWYGFSALSNLATLPCPRLMLGAAMHEGLAAAVFALATSVISGAIVYGLLKRVTWGKWLCAGWQVTSALIATLAGTAMVIDMPSVLETYREFMPWAEDFLTGDFVGLMSWGTMAFTWLVTLVVISYVLLKKDYFER